uniref:LCCL domain-containing protein n=1 Tax=Neogobius melanostomus TaxID=47308 RepID=A0A8C6TP19_9GOBI
MCRSAAESVSCLTRGADFSDDRIVLCPPDCTQWRLSVFGSNVFASVSSICGAAIHR